jgi:unsaturated chondroitin disaccharide hydrolase
MGLQAWGLYGYTVMYRITKDEKYLQQATKIADFMLNHPNMPGDKIPYWDYNAPNIPDALRDASAGAIMASALLELSSLQKISSWEINILTLRNQ